MIKAWSDLEESIITCRECPRLVEWRETIAKNKRKAFNDWEYWGKPVVGFGDREGSILIVGLAPGAHGSNRTGRMFTGDASGDFLYKALYNVGFANQPQSVCIDDSLSLKEVFISAVCRCAPPENRPTKSEIYNCRKYLQTEISLLKNLKVIVPLGHIAFDTIIYLYRQSSGIKFNHGHFYKMNSDYPTIVASYHPSKQNTQTGRLTKQMFAKIWDMVGRELIARQ